MWNLPSVPYRFSKHFYQSISHLYICDGIKGNESYVGYFQILELFIFAISQQLQRCSQRSLFCWKSHKNRTYGSSDTDRLVQLKQVDANGILFYNWVYLKTSNPHIRLIQLDHLTCVFYQIDDRWYELQLIFISIDYLLNESSQSQKRWHINSIYRTNASIVPPFFRVKFVLKWGGALHGCRVWYDYSLL